MISVYAARQGSRVRLLVTGHAAATPDATAVCAGVSAITGALLGFAANESSARHLRVQMQAGEAFLSCRGGLGAAFDAAVYGLAEIARRHPENVRFFGEALTTNAPTCDTIGTMATAV